jgi:large subunit ribosomal protein L24
MNIKKNDNVIIVKGKDRGKSAKVSNVLPKIGKIVLTGLNKYKKHIKPSKSNPQGGIVDISMAMPASNVLVICPSCTKSTRVKYKITDTSKNRICAKCKQSLEG